MSSYARARSQAPTTRSTYGTTSSSTYGSTGLGYTSSSTTVQPGLAASRTRPMLDDRAPGASSLGLRRPEHTASMYSQPSATVPRQTRGMSPAVGRQPSYAQTDSRPERTGSSLLPRSQTDYPSYSGDYDPASRRPSLGSGIDRSGTYYGTTSSSSRYGRDSESSYSTPATDYSTNSGRYGAGSSSGGGGGGGAASTMMPPARVGSSASLRAAPSSRTAPTGFRNIGNTCYMNSALQCILHSSSGFIDDLSREPIRHASEARSRSTRTSTTTPEPLATALTHLSRADGATSALLSVKTGVSRMNAEFVGARQNDAHEFIRELLHGVHKETNRPSSKPKYVEMKDIPGESDNDAARRWITYSKTHDDSIVYDHFGGFLRSVTKCGGCGNRSFVFDPFLDLSVNVTGSVLSSLAKMNEFETVSVFTCENCKKKGVSSLRQTVVVEWPRVLVLHLKRFAPSGRKDATGVRYPLRISREDAAHSEVVLPRSSNFPQQGYTLSGVVLHHGQMGYGHYTAYVRQGTTWYECDDGCVTRASESTVLDATPAAYVLFYSSED